MMTGVIVVDLELGRNDKGNGVESDNWRLAIVSPEHILHFAEQSPQHRLIIYLGSRLQFLQQLFLALAQLARNLHPHFHVKIALAVTIQNRYTLVADAKCGSGLGSIWNLERVLAFESGYANLRTHGGLRHRERDGAVQIIPFPHKKRMLLHMQH